MEKLKQYFIGKGEVKGFTFKQIKRTHDKALYEVKNDKNVHFEVITILNQKAKKATIKGKEVLFQEKETYPSSKYFGVSSWTFNEFEKALSKFNYINSIEYLEYRQLCTQIHF